MSVEQNGQTVFRYRMSGVGWLCVCLLLAQAATVIAFPEWARIILKSGAFLVLPMLTLVPALIVILDIVCIVQARVIVTHENIRWRGIRGSGDVRLSDILAVGAPSTAWQRTAKHRIFMVAR